MINLIASSLKKYVDFQGRATRKEFWSFFVFFNSVSFIAGLLNSFIGTELVGNLFLAGFFLPYISVAVRRMNDVGKSGWFIAVPIYNLILFCTPSMSRASSPVLALYKFDNSESRHEPLN